MFNRAIKLSFFSLPALLLGVLLYSSCTNSLNDIQKIASKEEDKPISTSTGVEIIYSDSAKVKARLTTPLMINFDDVKKPYYEMPKGVKIVFFDEDLQQKGTITSDYAIQLEKDNMIEFRKNVVATNSRGETFRSDELFYDQNNKKLYSNKAVQITMAAGNVIDGSGFNSNESLYPWHIDNSKGIFHVDEKQVQ
jgi:LPS export ABC transporter protein LptC